MDALTCYRCDGKVDTLRLEDNALVCESCKAEFTLQELKRERATMDELIKFLEKIYARD